MIKLDKANIKNFTLKPFKLIRFKFFKLFEYDTEGVFYIGGAETLPPPLEKEEEEVLLEKLKNGDVSIRRTLIERNLRLVVYIAKKFENTGIYVEDLISIGTIGLIKAINTFDPCKKIKLATYASRCIENEILMYMRKNANLYKENFIQEKRGFNR